MNAAAVLPDGRVVTGGDDGRVLVWDPATAGAGPVELGRHDGAVSAAAVLPDGRVVSGWSDEWVLVWDLQTRSTIASLACPARAIAIGVEPSGGALLVIAQAAGLTTWTIPSS